MAQSSKRSGGASRKQPAKKQPANGGAPRWVMFGGGLLTGLFVALLVHLHHQDEQGLTGSSGGDTASKSADADSGDGSSSGNQPRFEFYELLSEMEVVVPEEGADDEGGPEPGAGIGEAVPTPETDAPSPETGSGDDGDDADAEATRYMVQAGSFRTHEDADRLKAELALIGVQAKIQSVEVDGGETWHRVRVGPFDSRDEVETLRSRLQEEDLDSILLRLRG
ncbi:MAG: SPOR domain-containing protein [Ectothiorhodospiraceae bacterium]